MNALSKISETLELKGNPNPDLGGTPKISQYEQSREERIRENLERMRSLGILDLSLKLKTQSRPTKRSTRNFHSDRKPARDSPLASPSESVRRSSRLQNATPVTYSEVVVDKKQRRSKSGFQLEKGSRPESYTEEQEKLLGNTERSWTLFVDGYAKDGKRIYDPFHGKTCHQCRQKTLGHRTQCCECNMVQGQFCGDCLYMRYGEHVLEALENENWVCPVCRGICNCSLCRNAKGWLPTGPIYRRISKLGYKSVAHYLVQTKRSEASLEEDSANQASAKRSLSFRNTETLPEEACDALPAPRTPKRLEKAEGEDDNKDGGCQSEKNNLMEENLNSARRSLPFSQFENHSEASGVVHDVQELNPDKTTESKRDESSVHGVPEMNPNNITEPESCREHSRKRKHSIEPNPDSIGARLRQRRSNKDSQQ